MGFLGNLISATVKTALTPLAVAKDAVNVIVGEEATSTKEHISSIGNDLEDMIEGN